MAKDKDNDFRLMGFGHRVYKNFDPRATIIKAACDKLLAKRHINDPIFDIAKQLEEVALNDAYFIERKLYPNVDFYSGVIYRAIGIPGADVHGAVRHGPAAGLDRPLAGNAPATRTRASAARGRFTRGREAAVRADRQARLRFVDSAFWSAWKCTRCVHALAIAKRVRQCA